MPLPTCILPKADTEVTGAFLTLQPMPRTSRLGKPFYQLLLADVTGHIPAYCLKSRDNTMATLSDTDAVRIRGTVRLRPKGWCVEIHDAEDFWPQFSTLDDTLRLMSPSLSPRPDAVVQLKNLLSELTIRPLRDFVHSALTDDRIADPFFQVPASVDNHHHQRGGLLVHSVETAQIAACNPHKSDCERELALVGALFHDVGKVVTMDQDGRRTSTGYLIHHDDLTQEILAAHLDTLHHQWEEGCNALRYIWRWRPGYQGDRYPRLLAAGIVRAADQISAASDAQNIAFEGKPNWQHFATLKGYGPAIRTWRVTAP